MDSRAIDPRYPVGRYQRPAAPLDRSAIAALIDDIERLPAELRSAVAGMNEEALARVYRPGGWTVRQVVHHVADSHTNAYVRWKLAVTEDGPTIKPYAEDRWAELPDARDTAIDVSLRLLDALHDRWTRFLRQLPHEAFSRVYHHPETGSVRLDAALALYSWHGKHHTAHIQSTRQ